VLALASGLAFDPRVPPSGDVLRRTGLFLAPLVGGLGSLGLAAHWRFRAACRVDPRASSTFLEDFEMSPNGRWVVMELRRRLSRGLDFQQIWLLDLEHDDLSAIPVDGAELCPPRGSTSAWLDESLFTIATGRGAQELWDALDGAMARTPRAAAVLGERSCVAWFPRVQSSGRGLFIDWPDRGVSFHSSDGDWGARSPEPGVFLYFDATGAFRRHDLTDGSDRVLCQGFDPEHLGLLRVDCDGTRVLVEDRQAARSIYLDARTGDVLVELSGEWRHRQWTGLDEPWAVVQARSTREEFPRSRVRFLGSRSTGEVTLDGISGLQVLPNDRLLYSPGPERLELCDHHGALVRTLFPLPDDVRVRRDGGGRAP
jgi:hypothetical protein